MARRAKLSKEKHKEIVAAIRAGVDMKVAVRAARVSMDAFMNWRNKGEKIANRREGPKNDQEQAFLDFYLDVYAAENECERWAVSKIAEAIQGGDLVTTRWFLEHRFPKRWLLRQQIGVSRDASDPKTSGEIEFVLATPKMPVPEDSFDEGESR